MFKGILSVLSKIWEWVEGIGGSIGGEIVVKGLGWG